MHYVSTHRVQGITAAMLNVSVDDRAFTDARPFSVGIARPAGPMADFVRAEIIRLGAPPAEVEAALAFVTDRRGLDIHAYEGMSPRMRRLVDLVGVAGRAVTAFACKMTAGDPAQA